MIEKQKHNNNRFIDSWLLVAIAFYVGYWAIYFLPFGIFFIISIVLFVRLLRKACWIEVLWVILFVALLQNIVFGISSGIAAYFFGIDSVFSQLATPVGKIVSLVMMEGKLLFSVMLAGSIAIGDVKKLFQKESLPLVRVVMYLLGGVVLLFALASIGMEHNGVTSVVGSMRNYASLVVIVLIGHFYAQLPYGFFEYFPYKVIRWGGWAVAVVNVVTQYILTEKIVVWQHILGVRFLYYVKILYAYVPLEHVVEGRFFTDFLGKIFMRSGGIFLEPVNYGFFQVLGIILTAYMVLNNRRTIDVLLLFLQLLLFFTNFGKGAFLLLSIILMTYIFRKVWYRVSRQVAYVWSTILLLIILSVFIVAPILSTFTMGHFSPMLDYLTYIQTYPEFLLFGQGIGTGGNYDASSIFRESAAIVTLAEVGLLWFMAYVGALITVALNGFQRRDEHPLLISFAVSAVLLFVISGVFQENAFSLQLSLFTVLPSLLILGNKRQKVD